MISRMAKFKKELVFVLFPVCTHNQLVHLNNSVKKKWTGKQKVFKDRTPLVIYQQSNMLLKALLTFGQKDFNSTQ